MTAKKILNIDENPVLAPVMPNAMRIGMSEKTFSIDFGTISETDGKTHAIIQSKIQIPSHSLRAIVDRFISAGILYEKKYETDIGFSKTKKTFHREEKKE